MTTKRNRPIHDVAKLFIQLAAIEKLCDNESIIRLPRVYRNIDIAKNVEALEGYTRDSVKKAVRGVMRSLCTTNLAYHIGSDYYDVTAFYYEYRIASAQRTYNLLVRNGSSEVAEHLVESTAALQAIYADLPPYPEKKSRSKNETSA